MDPKTASKGLKQSAIEYVPVESFKKTLSENSEHKIKVKYTSFVTKKGGKCTNTTLLMDIVQCGTPLKDQTLRKKHFDMLKLKKAKRQLMDGPPFRFLCIILSKVPSSLGPFAKWNIRPSLAYSSDTNFWV